MKAPFPELEPIFAAAQEGRLDEALALAHQLNNRSSGPLALEAQRHLGLIYFHLGDPRSALPYLEAVARQEGSRGSWFVLAIARTRANEPEAGEEAFLRALAAVEPAAGASAAEPPEGFLRFDYMAALTESWQWERAWSQLQWLDRAVRAQRRHDEPFLRKQGLPALHHLLEAGLAVHAIVPDSQPMAWLQGLEAALPAPARPEVRRAIQRLRLTTG